MAIAPLTPLPSPPLSTDTEAVFNSKADATLLAEKAFVEQMNSSTIPGINQAVTDAQAARDAAAGSATAAAGSAATASQQAALATTNGQAQVQAAAGQKDLAVQARQGAEAARDQSQLYASAAGAAAGLPAVAGHAGHALTVKQDESGYELTDVGMKIGDLLLTTSTPDSTFVRAGQTYLQSAYPELYSVLGLVPSNLPWVAATTTAGNLLSAAFGAGMWLVIGNTGSCSTSTDGVVWTAAASLGESSQWTAIAYGAGLFIAAGSSNINYCLRSSNGAAWTTTNLPSSGVWGAIAFGNGTFVLLDQTGNAARAATSPDGITWTLRAMPAGTWHTVRFANGLFIALRSGTAVYATSPDGITWTLRNLPKLANLVGGGGGKFVAISSGSNEAYVSNDAVSWVRVILPFASSWSAVVYGGGAFLISTATSTHSSIISKDALTWDSRVAAAGLGNPTYGMGLFLAFSGQNAYRMPLADYDQSTQFYVPQPLSTAGYSAYIKAKYQ